jgi:hypothetical protein
VDETVPDRMEESELYLQPREYGAAGAGARVRGRPVLSLGRARPLRGAATVRFFTVPIGRSKPGAALPRAPAFARVFLGPAGEHSVARRHRADEHLHQ